MTDKANTAGLSVVAWRYRTAPHRDWHETECSEVARVEQMDGSEVEPLHVTAASAEARIAELERERDDADRRAGAAERQLEDKIDSIVKRRQWLSRAKAERGYHDNTSFDRVWADTCAAADRAQAAEARADRLAMALERIARTPSGMAGLSLSDCISTAREALQQEG